MYRKIALILLFGFLLTGCGSMTEGLTDNALPVGEGIETELETEPETTETTAPEETETEETTGETTAAADTEMPSETESEVTETPETIPEEQQESTESGLIPGIHLGMTTAEVFAVVGENYANTLIEDFYENTVQYDYIFYAEIDGIFAPGYAFFEFDADSQLLICYGYHFGHNGNFDSPEYPLSEEDLAAIHDAYLEEMTEWYGAPGEPLYQIEDEGLRSESTWINDEGIFWLMYGVNLWAWEEPEQYAQGINEVVVSCSAR